MVDRSDPRRCLRERQPSCAMHDPLDAEDDGTMPCERKERSIARSTCGVIAFLSSSFQYEHGAMVQAGRYAFVRSASPVTNGIGSVQGNTIFRGVTIEPADATIEERPVSSNVRRKGTAFVSMVFRNNKLARLQVMNMRRGIARARTHDADSNPSIDIATISLRAHE